MHGRHGDSGGVITVRMPQTQPSASFRASFGKAWIAFAAASFLLFFAGLVTGLTRGDSGPEDQSAEAGFARDMAIHHGQAVEMGEIIRMRTTDPSLRVLAKDIVLTQQSQIGRLHGWLDAWSLPPTGQQRAMTWMGHPSSGPMPGMASADAVRSLNRLPPDEMDIRFLQLMIPHHQAAVAMAQAVLDRTDQPAVRAFATGLLASQRAEIEYMRQLLEERLREG